MEEVTKRLSLAIHRRESYIAYRQQNRYKTRHDKEIQEDLEAMQDALALLKNEPVVKRDPEPVVQKKTSVSAAQIHLPVLEKAVEERRYTPLGKDNPFRDGNAWNTTEELKEISRWYRYLVRSMIVFSGEWVELGRFKRWESAMHFARMTAYHKQDQQFTALVVLKCTLQGKEGREIPCAYYPDEPEVVRLMEAARDKRIRPDNQGGYILHPVAQ